MEHEAAIKLAEALAISHDCSIELEDIAPVYVPAGYESDSDIGRPTTVSKVFANGSVISLHLLPF
jgi:hypothetical protein